uniref:hypothetical protein n=1 Tax=Ningiella ruwaisensis TaxID=2364274 RepID=UPI00109F84EE|nr:hypothetical protein [Ningiella ruwaisensis]
MSATLTIKYEMRLHSEYDLGPSLHFNRWIPDSEDHAIIIVSDSTTVIVRIDKSCITEIGDITDEIISKSLGLQVGKMIIEVIIDGINKKLADFI